MINKRDFLRLIGEARFKELFVTELGWNLFKAQAQLPAIVTDEKQYDITAIAERNGFQILTCQVDELPSNSACRKIDTKLRRQANDYICIFMERGTTHHLWVVPVKNNEKRDLTFVEYANADQADLLYSKVEGFSFELGEETNIVDLRAKVHKAFIVNSEKITKDFYTGFRKEHKAFTNFISGINDDIPAKDNRNKQWYTSVMLNRLMFCYFIQKKGFLNGDFDYLRHKLEWVKREQGENHFFHSFYKGFLINLFHDGLNAPRHTREWEMTYGRIPYLNGGMFDVHELEQDYDDIDIADEAFERLFAFFDSWRWHLDTRITASGKDINPDVLGYIFEQYINDRAAMGAYYTKEDITEYIGKNCILPFLMDKVAETDKAAFKPDGDIWTTLKNSGDTYIYDAVKRGYTPDWQQQIPDNIAAGVDTTQPNLLERRKDWNTPTPDRWALPTEIWRETIERLQRCDMLLGKIKGGEITAINDFITYNLDIRSFVYDLLHNTGDHLLVKHFYRALQHVTILDPTCGSGAFLFAAMNILEPLYEVCIERMQEFNEANNLLFKEELAEITNKYRSNIQYFIFKSIILRNLYGVDIMVEATEIAKLRLFLKMVAVVEVDRRADNMGLDPLPDIDFNIRCGNTLVGYATEQQLLQDLNRDTDIMQMEANLKFKKELDNSLAVVATTYKRFKEVQLTQDADLVAFKQAKKDLNLRLEHLNEILNLRLFNATSSGDYDNWQETHQPFHWLAEFYQIIHGKDGFDVIIGNPPYVVYTESKFHYRVSSDYKTKDCCNLYAYCIERCQSIISTSGRFGMIVPNSSISANKMIPLQSIITQGSDSWISNYSWRPSKLFEGADMLLAIILRCKSNTPQVYSTVYHKWYNEYRGCLFKNLKYTNSTNIKIEGSIPKLPSSFVVSILDDMKKKCGSNILPDVFCEVSDIQLYYFRAVQYWFKILDREPIFEEDGIHKTTGEMKPLKFNTIEMRNAAIAVLSSNLFFLNYIIWSSCQVVNSRDFRISFDFKALENNELEELSRLGKELQEDYQNHSQVIKRHYSKKGREFTMEKQHFFIKFSKHIIDEIDKVLAGYYGFSEEELDFIINYDIKYRMGDELNNE